MALSFGKLLENIDRRIDSETLDEFRDHLEASIRRREKSLQKEYSSLSEEQFDDPEDIKVIMGSGLALTHPAQPGSPRGRCAIKPRSDGDFYVGRLDNREIRTFFIHANAMPHNRTNCHPFHSHSAS